MSMKDHPVSAPKVGARMPDRTIYAGISPDTNQPMYAAPADARKSMFFNEAAQYAEGLEVDGKKDFRVPSEAELKVLFQNCEKGALKGTVDDHTDWYWPCSPDIVDESRDPQEAIVPNDIREGRRYVRCVR